MIAAAAAVQCSKQRHECMLVEGFKFPTWRRAHPCLDNRAPVRDKVLVSIDLSDFKLG